MTEKLVIVPKLVAKGRKTMTMAAFVVACILLLLATFLSPIIFFIPALIMIAVWVYLGYTTNIEFEYTYFDGELRFAKITNKARRKKIAEINMEDVLILAPKGDRAVYKYENDKNMKCKNLCSGSEDARVYELIAKDGEKLTRFEIEPDEEMLNAICVKYARVVNK